MELKKKLMKFGIIAAILICVFVVLIIVIQNINKQDKEHKTNQSIEDESKYEKITKKIATYVVKGEYEAIVNMFSDDLKEKTTLQRFKEEFSNTLFNVGDFVKYADIYVTENEDSISSKAFIEFKEKDICVNLFLDTWGNIDGITLDYCTVPNKTKTYEEHYVSIGKYSLHGLLTLPKKKKNPPVVVFVHDIDNTDMNLSMYENKPFSSLAHSLAKKGIASLRYNKRFYQYAKLESNVYTVNESILDDVSSAIEFVSKDKRVDTNNIYVIGIGLGGSLSPIIAKNNPTIKGIICLAGSPRNILDILQSKILNEIKLSRKSKDAKIKETKLVKEAIAEVKTFKKNTKGYTLGYSKAFLFSLSQMNIEQTSKELEIPMLFMQGSLDYQTYAKVDFVKWQQVLNGKNNCTFKLYDNLNHLFMKSDAKNLSESKIILTEKGKIDSQVIDDMASWIKEK